MNEFLFQYCPKIAVLSQDGKKVLLCKRKDEKDYDGIFSLIGGKMEHSDSSIIEALHREKSEEVGNDFKLSVMASYSVNVSFVKKDGSYMILPHFLAQHIDGAIKLNNKEYSEYVWVDLAELSTFKPKIANISQIVPTLIRARSAAIKDDFVEI